MEHDQPSKQERSPALQQQQNEQPESSTPGFANLTELVAAVDRVAKAFLAQQGIPSEQTTFEALRACAQADLKRIHDVEKHHRPAGVTPSPLLDLDKSKKGTRSAAAAANTAAQYAAQSESLRAQDVVDKISTAAYTIISHPNVVITPRLLKAYIKIQAHFGKPETLPEVLELFAAKPKPRLSAGSIEYVGRNPARAENAVDKDIAESALTVAIEAEGFRCCGRHHRKQLCDDCIRAVQDSQGYHDSSCLPYHGANRSCRARSAVLLFQDAMDQALASKIALAGMLAYAGFMASLGVVVVTTANDQMKRVTWTPRYPPQGTDGYARTSERLLDKVACAFGFSDKLRWGEEVGAEWEALREYILRRSMILDSVELMEDVNPGELISRLLDGHVDEGGTGPPTAQGSIPSKKDKSLGFLLGSWH